MPEVAQVLADERVVLVGQLTRRYALPVRRHHHRRPVLVRPAHHQDVVPLQPVVAREDVRRHREPGHVADVPRPARVGPAGATRIFCGVCDTRDCSFGSRGRAPDHTNRRERPRSRNEPRGSEPASSAIGSPPAATARGSGDGLLRAGRAVRPIGAASGASTDGAGREAARARAVRDRRRRGGQCASAAATRPRRGRADGERRRRGPAGAEAAGGAEAVGEAGGARGRAAPAIADTVGADADAGSDGVAATTVTPGSGVGGTR